MTTHAGVEGAEKDNPRVHFSEVFNTATTKTQTARRWRA